MTFVAMFSLLRDCIVSFAAIIGAVVAVKGLNTWRRQLKGQSEYDLARRLLVTLYKYRDAINGVRHPAIWANEIPAPSADAKANMTPGQVRYFGTCGVYQARWDKVQNEKTKLYADLLESEALWGIVLKNAFKSVYDLEHELYTNIRQYLEIVDPDTDTETRKAITNLRKEKRDIMYDYLSDKDEFSKDFADAVECVEKYLKPKLIH